MARRLSLLALLVLIVAAAISSPNIWWNSLQQQLVLLNAGLFSNSAGSSWDLFRHLGGNGPWVPRIIDDSRRCRLPDTCSIVQAHMISRHAERYPTLNAGKRHIALLQKLHGPKTRLKGSLSFVKDWTYFTDLHDPHFEDLTSTGPYAGTLQAYSTGQKLRTRYDHIVPKDRTVNFWTCDSPRDIETARLFGSGFFGDDWEATAKAKLHIIPEGEDRGGDTLTPGRSCRNYRSDPVNGRIDGYVKLAEFQVFMAQAINQRLSRDAVGLKFTPLEIYGMMELCGFEAMVRGSSPWCKVFTQDEWLHYEYARDLLHFYRAGPGNPYAGALGWLWLNATKQQLANSSANGVYHSFVHDGDIIPLLATMGVLDEDGDTQSLPVDRIKKNRHWKTSDIVPMGGRVILERVDCRTSEPHVDGFESYIRLVLNDGLFDLKHLIGESNLACAVQLDTFQQWVNKKGDKFGGFREQCGIDDDLPGSISFLHQ